MGLQSLSWASPLSTGLLYPKLRAQTSGIIQKLYETKTNTNTGWFKSVYWLFSEIKPKMCDLARFHSFSWNQLEKLEAAKAAWLVCLSLLSLTGPYLALLSLTWPYWALLGLTGPYWASLGLTGPYLVLLGLTGPYWALLGLTRPYWALLSLI